MTTKRNEL